MQVRNRSGDGPQELLVIDNPEAIRLMFSVKHNKILKKLAEQELSISDLARSLGMNPGSVHYYLKDLEKQGLARQVREEIKGGIVKKFYRAAARRICIEGPDFDDALHIDIALPERFSESFLGMLGQMGYSPADESREDAKDLLIRYDKRVKELIRETHNPALEGASHDSMQVRHAGFFLVHMRAMSDPEMARIYSQFTRLFFKVG